MSRICFGPAQPMALPCCTTGMFASSLLRARHLVMRGQTFSKHLRTDILWALFIHRVICQFPVASFQIPASCVHKNAGGWITILSQGALKLIVLATDGYCSSTHVSSITLPCRVYCSAALNEGLLSGMPLLVEGDRDQFVLGANKYP